MLYFYPFYESEKDLKELRIDEDVLHEIVKSGISEIYVERIFAASDPGLSYNYTLY